MFGYRLIRKRELMRFLQCEDALILQESEIVHLNGQMLGKDRVIKEKTNTISLYEDEIIRLKKELGGWQEKYTPNRDTLGKFKTKNK